MTQSFQVTTQRLDGTGGPVVEVDGIADNDYAAAAVAGLAATGVSAGGGVDVSFVHKMDTGHAGRLGQATETTLAGIDTVLDALTAKLPAAAASADSLANPTVSQIGAVGLRYNGSTWDRERGNLNVSLLSSLARTGDPSKPDQTNYNARGLHLVTDVTAIADTPSITVTIEGKDEVSGKYYTLLASAAITGTGTTILKIYPGLAVSANASANDVLPRTWRCNVAHSDSDSITYSIGATLIL